MNREEAKGIISQKSIAEIYAELEAKSVARTTVGRKRGYTNADIAAGVEKLFKEVQTARLLMSATLKMMGGDAKFKGLKMQELRSICSDKYKLKMTKDEKGRVYMTHA